MKVKPSAQGTSADATEQWLRDNDPNYDEAKRAWIAPTTDALCRARSETNAVHTTLEDLTETVPKGRGAYRRRHGNKHELTVTAPPDEIQEMQSEADFQEPTD
jgi:hypothetical protein